MEEIEKIDDDYEDKKLDLIFHKNFMNFFRY